MKLITVLISLLLTTQITMASAKARYYANQAKKGNISSSQASSAMSGKGLNVAKQVTQKKYQAPLKMLPDGTPDYVGQINDTYSANKNALQYSPGSENSKQNSSNEYSSTDGRSKTSNRQKASQSNSSSPSIGQQVFNTLTGTPSAEASGRPGAISIPSSKQNTSGWLGDLFNTAGQSTKDFMHSLGMQVPDLGLSENLGINKNVQGGLMYNTGDTPASYTDESGQTMSVNPSSPDSVFYTNPSSLGYVGQQGLNTPQSNQPTDNGTIFAQDFNRRTGNRNSATPIYNQTPLIYQNSPYTAQNNVPSFVQQNPSMSGQDNTPTQGGGNTPPMSFGSGQLARGQYGNGMGASNSPLAGYSMGGHQDPNSALNDLLSFFGNTANAQEMPQAMGQDYMSHTNPIPGISNQSMYSMQGNVPTWNQSSQAPQTSQNMNIPSGSNGGGSSVGNAKQQNTAPVATNTQMGGGGMTQKDFNKQFGMSNKSYEKQQGNIKKQLEDLVKQINSQYDQSQTQQTGVLNQNQNQDLLRNASQFNFGNSDPNDEQRNQYSQRISSDYGTQLATLLSNLAQAKNKDITSAKSNSTDALNTLLQSQQSAQNNAATQWRNYQQQQFSNALALRPKQYAPARQPAQKTAASYAPDGSYTFGEVDPSSGMKIFYDPTNNQPFING